MSKTEQQTTHTAMYNAVDTGLVGIPTPTRKHDIQRQHAVTIHPNDIFDAGADKAQCSDSSGVAITFKASQTELPACLTACLAGFPTRPPTTYTGIKRPTALTSTSAAVPPLTPYPAAPHLQGVTYSVQHRRHRSTMTILDGISGFFKPGQMSVLVGPLAAATQLLPSPPRN
jgi:hypothetical protein